MYPYSLNVVRALNSNIWHERLNAQYAVLRSKALLGYIRYLVLTLKRGGKRGLDIQLPSTLPEPGRGLQYPSHNPYLEALRGHSSTIVLMVTGSTGLVFEPNISRSVAGDRYKNVLNWTS